MAVVFLSLSWLILSLEIKPDTSLATSLELLYGGGSGLEEAAPSTRKSAILSLVVSQKDFSPLELSDGLRRIHHRAGKGETFRRLFLRYGLSETERKYWLRSVQKHYPLNGLRPGQEVNFYFSRGYSLLPDEAGAARLRALEIGLDEDWVLAWERGNQGIVFSKRERPYEIELKNAAWVIERSFAADGLRAGLDQSVISQLADIFSWEIDFHREIHRGDRFKLLVEEKSRVGRKQKRSFRILAAEAELNGGQKYSAIYFEKEKGKGNYYDLDGRSLAGAFLRFPLEFSRISSYFSHARFHPILKVDRPHTGVDFKASRGTPVRAIGDGKVLFGGWRKGGYGRLVEIQHDPVYFTRYAHLQRLARGIRRGARVKKGQVIGYVGSSGRATGPHLHFELYKDQQYTDPLKFQSPPEDSIEPPLRRVFETAKQLFLAELASTPHS